MIQSLDELIQWTHELCSLPTFPLFLRRETLIQRPGCSEAEIQALLSEAPLLPSVYLDVIRQIDINQRCLLIFGFSRKESAYTGDPLYDALNAHQAYEIGTLERDMLAVVYEDGFFRKEQILVYDLCAPEVFPPRVLANRFDQCLFLIGTLHQLFYKARKKGRGVEAQADWKVALNVLYPEATTDSLKMWQTFGEMYLSQE